MCLFYINRQIVNSFPINQHYLNCARWQVATCLPKLDTIQSNETPSQFITFRILETFIFSNFFQIDFSPSLTSFSEFRVDKPFFSTSANEFITMFRICSKTA